MRHFLSFCFAACVLVACTTPQGPALTESEVSAFAIDFHAGLVGFDEAIPVWQDGLLPSSSYFNAGMRKGEGQHARHAGRSKISDVGSNFFVEHFEVISYGKENS